MRGRIEEAPECKFGLFIGEGLMPSVNLLRFYRKATARFERQGFDFAKDQRTEKLCSGSRRNSQVLYPRSTRDMAWELRHIIVVKSS